MKRILIAVACSTLCALVACQGSQGDTALVNEPQARSPQQDTASTLEASPAVGAARAQAPRKKAPALPREVWRWTLDQGTRALTQSASSWMAPSEQDPLAGYGCHLAAAQGDSVAKISCMRGIYTGEGTQLVEFEASAVADTAALIGHKDVLYVVEHSGMASGASAAAYDLKAKTRLWHVPLKGLGPVSHSKYLNEVQVEYDELTGELVVFGKESQGAYVERRGARDGALKRLTHYAAAEVSLSQLPATADMMRPSTQQLQVSGSAGGADASYTLSAGEQVTLRRESMGSGSWERQLSLAAGSRSVHERGLHVVVLSAQREQVTAQVLDTQTGQEVSKRTYMLESLVPSDSLQCEREWQLHRQGQQHLLRCQDDWQSPALLFDADFELRAVEHSFHENGC